MSKGEMVDGSGDKFAQLLESAAKLPGVQINRAAFLRSTLKPHCSDDQIEEAIATSPAAAGVSEKVIKRAADASIRLETSKVAAISALAGVPGGFAMLGSVPADVAQYFGHMLRVSQKLAYLYSWPELFDEETDDATKNILTLFVGVMAGVNAANVGVSNVSKMMAGQAVKKLPKTALTKGAIYPMAKSVAKVLGVRMTKQIFANGVAKSIPILGAVVSGGLTLGSFLPMARRLQTHLADTESI